MEVVAIVALSSLTYGYAFSVFSTSIGLPGFYADLKLATTGEGSDYTAAVLGAINALFSAGAAFGALSIAWLPDWLGRKRAIILAGAISLVGSALVAGSVNIPMLVVTRLIQGVGVGQCITITPIYLSEVSTPERRGLLAGQSACFMVIGYFLSSWVGYGAYFATNPTFAWRFPLALSCLFPLMLLIGCPWVPESPRWRKSTYFPKIVCLWLNNLFCNLVLWKDRADEAWTITERLHRDPSDPQQIGARQEFHQMRKQIEFDRTQDLSMLYMFKKPSLRRRILLGCGVLFGGQACGPLVINNYGVLLYQGLGMSGHMPLLMYAIYVVVGASVNIIAAFIMDRVGRRPLFFAGFLGTTVTMACETALVATYAGTDNKGGNAAAVFFLFAFVTMYGLCIDNTAFVFTSEIFPTMYRAKGVALGLFVYYIGSIAFLTPTATAMQTIGWRFYLVFVCCSFVAFVMTYFFVPEVSFYDLRILTGS
jgi:MFS family permease